MKVFSDSDIQTARSFLTQLVDVIQEDISGSVTRRKYQVFVTGGIGPGITSSLFQTVYDQDFTLQTANPVLDMTIGLFHTGSSVYRIETATQDDGKKLFPSTSVMMREKIDLYRSFAKQLLGDADQAFYAPFANNSATVSADQTFATNITGLTGQANLGLPGSKDRIDEALFIGFKRLFHRDGIKKETFATKFFTSASKAHTGGVNIIPSVISSGSVIFTDAGASSTFQTTNAGHEVGNIVNSNNADERVGLIFYDKGVCVFDLRKITSGTQHMSGAIDAMNSASSFGLGTGKAMLGNRNSGNLRAVMIPDFITSASIDDFVDHIGSTRFGSGSLTACTFQNKTNINSTLYFARATADEFNYSSNSTYLDSVGNINVIDASARQNGDQKAFSFVTKVGLHDAQGNLLAVAKLSRPVEKNSEKDVTFRVRLDF
jgi:hypothetical protein